jgi:hypothetical protein
MFPVVTTLVVLALATGVGIAAAALISDTDTSGFPSAGLFGVSPVHNGDTVAMSGTVMVLANGAARFCPHSADAVADVVDTRCDDPVALTGLRADELTGSTTVGKTLIGRTYIEGTWHDGTVVVRTQGAPKPVTPGRAADSRPPCPAPKAGWQATDPGWQPPPALVDFINSRPQQFAGLGVAYPSWEAGAGGDDAPGPAEVVVVGVVGDQSAARAEISAIYSGNLCLTTALYSAADLDEASATIQPHVGQWGILSATIAGWQPGMEMIDLEVVVVNDHVWDLVKEAGPDMVNVQPVIRKISAS